MDNRIQRNIHLRKKQPPLTTKNSLRAKHFNSVARQLLPLCFQFGFSLPCVSILLRIGLPTSFVLVFKSDGLILGDGGRCTDRKISRRMEKKEDCSLPSNPIQPYSFPNPLPISISVFHSSAVITPSLSGAFASPKSLSTNRASVDNIRQDTLRFSSNNWEDNFFCPAYLCIRFV